MSTAPIPLLPVRDITPNQRWEQSSPQYLNSRKWKEITLLALGILASAGIVSGFATLVALGAKENDFDGNHPNGMFVGGLLPLIFSSIGFIGILGFATFRIYNVAMNACFPYNLNNPTEVFKIRRQLLESHDEVADQDDDDGVIEAVVIAVKDPFKPVYDSLKDTYSYLEKTGILASDVADQLTPFFKRYELITEAKKELEKYSAADISDSTSLQDRSRELELRSDVFNAEWKAFQTGVLVKNLPNPDMMFSDLD